MPENATIPVTERRRGSLTFAAVAFLAGILLVLLPWSDSWYGNSLQRFIPALQQVWGDAYFRGGVTGLGVVNIYLACLEISRLRRIT